MFDRQTGCQPSSGIIGDLADPAAPFFRQHDCINGERTAILPPYAVFSFGNINMPGRMVYRGITRLGIRRYLPSVTGCPSMPNTSPFFVIYMNSSTGKLR